MTTVLDAAYFRSLRKPEPEAEPEYPAPEHTSRDPWPEDFPMPGPVAAVKAHAERHGWSVVATYSRGCLPHSSHGTPLALAHHVALRMVHPETGARCAALYSIPVDKPDGKKWTGILIASRTVSPYAGCSITDAREWLALAGRMLPGWLDAVKRRRLLDRYTDKVWSAYCAGRTVTQIARDQEIAKDLAMEIITACRRAGKAKPTKTSKRREGAS